MNEEYSFELFRGVKGKYNVKVSLSKPGVLSFSAGMSHKYDLSKYIGAQLFFDENKKAIAVKMVQQEVPDMFKMKTREGNKGSFISCKSFLSAYGLESYYGKRYSPKELEHPELGSIFIIELENKE
ncbi:MAG: hypothetical protein HGA33_04230 [Candidatus Moranbacteria bacterium]|nr:hypothetical protein [Candidatus Moranbacteria bacterium]